MVITSLQEKENRKFYVPIRPGNRGGWSLFEWQSVREMPYRDREMYLGNSAMIGVLDKGGKWRKRDWYLKTDKKYDDPNLSSEQQQAIRRDMERMNAALGKEDIEDDEKLTEQEMQQLLQKIKNKDTEFEPSKQAVGLGFDKTRVQIRAKPSTAGISANRIQGIDQLEVHEPKVKLQHKQRKRGHKDRDQDDSRSVESHKAKKIKKQKKQKKEKKHKKRHSRSREKQSKDRSRSKSKDRKHKKQKHRKHRHRSRSSSRD